MQNNARFSGFSNRYLDDYLWHHGAKIDSLGLRRYVIDQIEQISTKTLITAVLGMQQSGMLEGRTAEERYHFFNDYSSTPEFLAFLTSTYPMLKTKLDRSILLLIENHEELRRRYCQDKEALSNVLDWPLVSFDRIEIDYGKSDFHCGMQSVAILACDRRKIVFKPRSGKVNLEWNKLLDWFNSRGTEIDLSGYQILDRGDYHWEEFVENTPCTNDEGIIRLYYRFGLLLSLINTFRGFDFHMENIISNGEYPILIDLETLFKPRINDRKDSNRTVSDEMNDRIKDSAIGSQLLPIKSAIFIENDISGITGHGGQIIPDGTLDYSSIFGEEPKLKKIETKLNYHGNIGILHGKRVNPKTYIKEICLGFEDGYKILLDNKEELISFLYESSLFSNCQFRYLFRSTDFYAKIIEMMNNSKYLHREDALTEIIAIVRKNTSDQIPNAVAEAEICDMKNGDTPYFTFYIDDNRIFDSIGNACFFFQSSPRESVLKTIQSLSLEDMSLQSQWIQVTLTDPKINSQKNNTRKPVLNPKVGQSKNDLLSKATAIGDFLQEIAVIHEDSRTINWYDPQKFDGGWSIQPMDHSLYNGLSGIALFYFALFQNTGNILHEKTFEYILNTIEAECMRARNKSGSVFCGLGSIAYLYAFLFNRTKEEQYKKICLNFVLENRNVFLNNSGYDLLDGLSGIIVLLSNIYISTMDSSILQLLESVQKKLEDNIIIHNDIVYWKLNQNKSPIKPGFAHGLAGIYFGLSKYYRVSGRREVLELVDRLVCIEDLCLDDLIKKGDSSSVEMSEKRQSIPINWCNGVSGIALARFQNMGLVDMLVDQNLLTQVILEDGLNQRSDCICHGNLGNLEIFEECNKGKSVTNLVRETYGVFQGRERKQPIHAFRNGLEIEYPLAGFMLGLSGVGYSLLKKAGRIDLPSLLTLEL